jgi:uncharacterized membrane protein YtjA (UPF0391 family)
MIKWTVGLLIIAAVAGVLGFGVLSASAASLAQAMCYAFLAMGLVCGACALFDLRHTV